MRTTKDVVRTPLFAALFVIMSLLVSLTPAAAGAETGDPEVWCGFWVLYIPPEGQESPEQCNELTDSDLRVAWSQHLLWALEQYGSAHGTYRVPDSGFDDRGTGWALYEGNRYSNSIARGLSDAGLFPPLESSRFWDETTALAASEGVVAIYQCEDRVAIFNYEETKHASPSDSNWWTDNGCNRYPIDQLGATYFELSRRLGDLEGASVHEDLRMEAVDAMLVALESHAYANGTYQVPDTGFDNGGHGWAFYEGGRYATSIASALIAEGHLTADPAHDPLWADTNALAAGEGAVMVYTCEERVAVFSPYATAQASTIEAKWWSDNGCARYPIDELGATYFRISRPFSCLCTSSGFFVIS